MLPQTGTILDQDFQIRDQPSKTYHLKEERAIGQINDLDAVRQAVNCILNTDRFNWLIYSWNYGVEITDLFGKPMNLVKSKIKKRIQAALTQDDRIERVDTFSFQESGRTLKVSFTVHTRHGAFQAGKAVKI